MYREACRRRLEAFADASCAEHQEDRGSVSGIVTKFCGASLSWFSETRACVASSSSEGENVALANCAKDVLYLRMIAELFRPKMPKIKVRILEDNEGAITFASNPICTNRTEHSDVIHLFLRETSDKDNIDVVNVCTLEEEATL